MAIEARAIRLPEESRTVPRMEPVASCGARHAGIARGERRRSGREKTRVADIGSPRSYGRKPGRTARRALTGRETKGNQGLYNMERAWFARGPACFFEMLPAMGTESLNHKRAPSRAESTLIELRLTRQPRAFPEREGTAVPTWLGRGIFNFLPKL